MIDQKIRIVIARYNEDLEWLYNLLLKNKYISATIYNDGEEIIIPNNVHTQIEVLEGDHIPCEPTKYLTYIITHWNTPPDERLVFLQGDPLYHNPTLLRVFDYIEQWDEHYQNLTLYPHPPEKKWGCSKEIENGTAPNITVFADDARVWCDTDMDEHFTGSYYYDDWVTNTLLYNKSELTVSSMCSVYGITKPSGSLFKTYSAMFATNWKALKKHPIEVWYNVYNFIVYGNRYTTDMSQKYRACITEYMWSVLLDKR